MTSNGIHCRSGMLKATHTNKAIVTAIFINSPETTAANRLPGLWFLCFLLTLKRSANSVAGKNPINPPKRAEKKTKSRLLWVRKNKPNHCHCKRCCYLKANNCPGRQREEGLSVRPFQSIHFFSGVHLESIFLLVKHIPRLRWRWLIFFGNQLSLNILVFTLENIN